MEARLAVRAAALVMDPVVVVALEVCLEVFLEVVSTSQTTTTTATVTAQQRVEPILAPHRQHRTTPAANRAVTAADPPVNQVIRRLLPASNTGKDRDKEAMDSHSIRHNTSITNTAEARSTNSKATARKQVLEANLATAAVARPATAKGHQEDHQKVTDSKPDMAGQQDTVDPPVLMVDPRTTITTNTINMADNLHPRTSSQASSTPLSKQVDMAVHLDSTHPNLVGTN